MIMHKNHVGDCQCNH